MKKILFIGALLAGSLTISAGANAQALSQGSVVVDAYYGFPNLGKSFYKNLEDASNVEGYKATGVGPLGIRGEYMISDRIGLGVDLIYNSNRITYVQIDSTYNGNTDTYTVTRNESERLMQRLRVQARINFHFEVNNPDLDAYFGIGAGTNNRFRKYWENGVEVEDTYTSGASNLTLVPVSFRLCTGLRYYFTENIGVNMEIGLGGPLISGGLSMKF